MARVPMTVGAALAALTVASLGIAGCNGTGTTIQVGSALRKPNPQTVGDKPMRPGTEIGLLDVDLQNGGSSTLVIDSVALHGPGIGTVATVTSLRIAPLRFGNHRNEVNAAPASLYVTSPPVSLYRSSRHKQALFPVHGCTMKPGP